MADLPPPPSSPPPPGGGWQQPQGGWQQQPPPQQIIVKQGSGCLKIGLIVLGILVIFGIGTVGCLVFAGNEVAKEIDKQTGEATSSDYEISDVECTNDEMLGAQATGMIQNLSDKAQGFEIEVRFETADGDLISEDSTITDTINVDQSQAWKVLSLEEAPEGAELTCELTEVSYTIFDDEGE